MAKIRVRKRFFWIILVISLFISGGHISATAADGSTNLVINEFMAANSSGLLDEDGDSSDWIEIYNQSPFPVNLSGWALTDDPEQPQKWMFPEMTLPGGDYLVVFASGKNRNFVGTEAPLHTNFKLSKSGDFLALHNVLEARFMDVISPQYPEQFSDVAYGRRYGDEEWSYGYLATPTPGGANEETLSWVGAVSPVTFSLERGFYEEPFSLELTSSTPEATIRYTTDGSQPTASHGTVYSGPLSIEQTTLLRAAAFRSGYLSSDVTTQSYILLDDASLSPPAIPDIVVDQSVQFSQTMAAYEEAQGRTGQTEEAAPHFRESFRSMPALSLVLETRDLADLYAYSDENGRDAERPVSIELIQPDQAETGFQVKGGIRLEAANATTKPTFRLFFRSQYGPGRLDYPLFSDSAVVSFDTLLLQPGPAPGSGSTAAYLRNQWLRDSQVAMSNMGVHGTFVQLYLNGMYWGLYNLTEKPNADFMASYLGGEKEDWFVADPTGPLNEGQGPQVDKLNYLFTSIALADRVGGELAQPEHLQALYAAAAAQIDPAHLIDYIILSWYAESLDWPASRWYAAVHLQDLPGRGKFLLGEESATAGSDSNFDFPGQSQPDIAERLFDAAMQDADFRIQFADRLYAHLSNDGALTDANAQARWLRLQSLVEAGLAAETARWHGSQPQTPASGAGTAEIDQQVTVCLSGQADSLLANARETGLYPLLDPPVFSRDGGLVAAGFSLTMTLPDTACQDCQIYYTTDGTDPRLPVSGEVSPGAVAYTGPVNVSANTRLKARVWQPSESGSVWSALHEATFSVMAQDNKLRVTEFMYNPLGGDDYEFVELQNVGDTELALANISFDEGIRFTFAPNTPALAPGDVVVLVSNPTLFAERYPDVTIAGAYEGHLSNKGEKVILNDGAGDLLLEIEYNDEYGWPVSADGRGDSLRLIDPAGNPSDPHNWQASAKVNGSPGMAEGF